MNVSSSCTVEISVANGHVVMRVVGLEGETLVRLTFSPKVANEVIRDLTRAVEDAPPEVSA